MNQNTDYTPVALYARVSSDRQDVDLSIAAQLRGGGCESDPLRAQGARFCYRNRPWDPGNSRHVCQGAVPAHEI